MDSNCSIVSPIFELGKIPKLSHCYIQERQYENGKWKYFVFNSYNSYASGWADEDFIIKQIEDNG